MMLLSCSELLKVHANCQLLIANRQLTPVDPLNPKQVPCTLCVGSEENTPVCASTCPRQRPTGRNTSAPPTGEKLTRHILPFVVAGV